MCGGEERIGNHLARLRNVDPLEVALVALALALCLDALVAVMLRSGFRLSLGFYDDLAPYLSVWMSFLGAAIAVKRHGHFGVSFLVGRVSPRIRGAVDVFNTPGMPLFAGFLVWEGLISKEFARSRVVPLTGA